LSERLAGDAAGIERAAAALRQGELVAFPTETVYGLGAIATNDRAVARIFEAKRRPRFNPLIVHVVDRPAAATLARWTRLADRLAERFWPGPLTLILQRTPASPLSPLVSAGGPTVALRAPAHPLARALLEATVLPVAAPSANLAGRISPTTADDVEAALSRATSLVLDGGRCPVGIESTVLDVAGATPRLLRPGGLPRAALEEVTGRLATGPATGPDNARELRAPGQLRSHYAPRHPVRLDAASVAADEALLAFGRDVLPGAGHVLNLSPAGDLVEAAANLFVMLHELDRTACRGIAVMPIPAEGLGEAIRDRLARAAAPRPAADRPG
jgi:L-threonylcarbamoyladenylate synthase